MDPDKTPWNQSGQPTSPLPAPSLQPPHPPPVVPGGALQPQAHIDPNSFYQPSAPVGPQHGASYQQPYAQPYQTQPAQPQYSANSSYAAQLAMAADSTPLQTPRQPFRKLVIGAVFLGLMSIVAIAAYSIFKPAPKPETVLQTALQAALATKSVTSSTTTSSATASEVLTAKYSLSSTKRPQISMVDTVTTKGKATSKLEGYGTVANTYLKIDQSAGVADSLRNTWIQLRKAGTLPDPIDTAGTHYPAYDPSYALLGRFAFANASASAQTSYLNYLQKQQIYSYNKAAVTKETLGNVAAYRYEITIKHPALLVKKEATLLGITDTAAINYATAALTANPKVVLHISLHNSQLLAANVGTNSIVLYGAYNTTTLPKAPKAALQYTAYGVLVASPGTVSDDAVNDAKRQSDLQAIQASLESYYANTDSYPSLTDMNSTDWVTANLPDLDQAALQDPTGKSPSLLANPAKNQYAYQVTAGDGSSSCESDDSTCQLYTLVATLNDGTTYNLQNAAGSSN